VNILAACHIHSDWSYDGSFDLGALSRKFSRAGYRVLLMTEHDRGFSADRLRQLRDLCVVASTNDLLIIPGIEYSDTANQVHILVWGNVPFLGEGLPTREILYQVKDAAGVAVLAHPCRKEAWKCLEPSWGEALLGIEVWNRKYDGWAPSRMAQDLQRSIRAVPFVGLDFHTQRQFFPLAMEMKIESVVNEQAVLDCMRARMVNPCLLGIQVDSQLLRNGMPLLGLAEKSRRRLAAVSRKLHVRL
jgi:predicted metal-dependent phosphoesterase TrpH